MSTNVGGSGRKICNELSCTDIGKIIKFGYIEKIVQDIPEKAKAENPNIKPIPKPNIKAIDALKNEIANKYKNDNFFTQDLNALFNNIKKILNASSNKNQINQNLTNHKKEVLAQVLLAFLYEKINLQETNINDGTKIFKDETVKGLKAAFGEGMFLAQGAQATQQDEASIAARNYFKSLWKDNPFPYLAAPIQNGPAYVVNHKGILSEKHTFPDCVEVAIRHFFNVVLYNGWENGTFNYQNLDITESKNDFFKNFYEKQPNRDLANNGSIDLRTMWNQVMSNIPEVIYRTKDDGTRIDKIEDMKPYQPKAGLPGNEIKAGIINLYNVLAYLLKEDQIPTETERKKATRRNLIDEYYTYRTHIRNTDIKDLEQQRENLAGHISEKFTNLLSQFNCEAKINLFEKDNASAAEPDLYGKVEILRNKKTILTLEMQNGHGLLTLNLNELPKEKITENDIIKKNPMLLLLPTGKISSDDQTLHPYYASFYTDLTFFERINKKGEIVLDFHKDTVDPLTFKPAEDELQYIRTFVAQTENNKYIGQSVKDYFKSFLYKIEIYEDEDDFMELNSKETKQFLNNLDKDDANRKYVKRIGIYSEHCKNTDLLKNLNKFENLKTLAINDKLGRFKIENLSIENCKNLEEIRISNLKNLQNLTIKNCPKFKGFSKTSLARLGNLITINIEQCASFEQLALEKNDKKFKKLDKIIIKNCEKFNKANLEKVNSSLVKLITE